MSLEQAPRWFLAVALTAVIAVIPLLLSQSDRTTVLETKMEIMERQDRERNQRFIAALDKLGMSVNGLDKTVAELKIEVRNIKEN